MTLKLCSESPWRLVGLTSVLFIIFLCSSLQAAHAQSSQPNAAPDDEERRQSMQRMSALTSIPWTYLAAVDRYEQSMKKRGDAIPFGAMTERKWSGALNPLTDDTAPASIAWFGGLGRDGSGDGIADRTNETDQLYSWSLYLQRYGTNVEDFAVAVWDYYQNTRSVQRVLQFAALYETFQSLDLDEKAFPLVPGGHYTYRGTWGAVRGWGGRRIHEGTDLFAPAGMPVRSTCYGVIETKGWNDYGGWRIGIRDTDNVYHYFAHLAGFAKPLAVGDTVKPGQIIGWVGSSGYGKPGTAGKFPPHLHYGMYRDHGYSDWAFDPYGKLRAWERQGKSR
jgi:hypothetical protein